MNVGLNDELIRVDELQLQSSGSDQYIIFRIGGND